MSQKGVRLFELSSIDIGPSRYHYLSKSVDNFLSDNFYKGAPKTDCYHKFPIGKKKIYPTKKSQKIIINEPINIMNSLRKSKHDFTSFLSNKNKFKTLDKTHSKYQINIIDELNENKKENNIDISVTTSQDLNQSKYKIKSPNFFRRIKSGMTNRIKTTRLIKPHSNKIIKTFSFLNLLPNKPSNQNKKNSTLLTPGLTMVKTKLKNSSFKSNSNNNISDNNSVSTEKDKNITNKFKTIYTLKLFEEKNNNPLIDDDLFMFSDNKISYTDRKHIRQKMKLNNLLYNIHLAKKKNVFKPNPEKIKSNLNFMNKFTRDLLRKSARTTRKNNLFFFKSPSNINKYEQLSQKNQKKMLPHQNMCDKKSKNILKNIEELGNFINLEKKNFKKNEIKFDINSVKYLTKRFRQKKDFDKKIDLQFKKNVMEYQKEIGRFYIYKGNWIYSSHRNTMLKGDKISKNLIIFKNL